MEDKILCRPKNNNLKDLKGVMVMRVVPRASSNVGYFLKKDDAIEFCGKCGKVCYERTTIDDIFAEKIEKSRDRAFKCIASGHHSILDHAFYSLSLEGIPKILAMILNNEKYYATSEKSARYTKMAASDEEKELYLKWIEIYTDLILKENPEFDPGFAEKLAQENARYLISVFTPATDMVYTTSLRQWNYIMYWAQEYIDNAPNDEFSYRVKNALEDFLYAMPDIKVDGLNTEAKGRAFSLFGKRIRREYFTEGYSVNYTSTFSALAQAHRHKPIKYEFTFMDKPEFYVPPIIKGTELEEEWLKDISSLAKFYPQGMLVNVNERGGYEDFIQKCTERFCGCAQLEIMQRTINTMERYLDAVKFSEQDIYNDLRAYYKPKCQQPHGKCATPCVHGPKNAFTRNI